MIHRIRHQELAVPNAVRRLKRILKRNVHVVHIYGGVDGDRVGCECGGGVEVGPGVGGAGEEGGGGEEGREFGGGGEG